VGIPSQSMIKKVQKLGVAEKRRAAGDAFGHPAEESFEIKHMVQISPLIEVVEVLSMHCALCALFKILILSCYFCRGEMSTVTQIFSLRLRSFFFSYLIRTERKVKFSTATCFV
jgi:hypothetical protein